MARAGWRWTGAIWAGVLIGGCAGSGAPTAAPSPRPSVVPAATQAGLTHFTAPGIAFDYPSSWVDQTAAWQPHGPVLSEADLPRVRGHRVIANLAELGPNGTDEAGSMLVSEYLQPRPSDLLVPVRDTKVAGQWARVAAAYDGSGLLRDQRHEEWDVVASDGGFYDITFDFPTADLARWRPRVDAVMASLAFSDWTLTPAPADNGRVRYDDGSIAFSYPAGWSVYYPLPNHSTGGSVILLLASKPLARCPFGVCENVPFEGAMQIQLEDVGLWTPDWKLANDTVSGLPAIREDDTWAGGEGHSWGVARSDSGLRAPLMIRASLVAPDVPALHQSLNELIASMQITPIVAPSPDPTE